MLEKIKSVFETISEEELREIEMNKEILLPDEYRLFLLRNNGGFPKPNTFTINVFQGESIMDVFFGISKEGKYKHLDLVHNIFETRSTMPPEIYRLALTRQATSFALARRALIKERYFSTIMKNKIQIVMGR